MNGKTSLLNLVFIATFAGVQLLRNDILRK